jgi:hypothetical protein
MKPDQKETGMRVKTKASFDKMTVQQSRIPDLSQMTGKTVLLDVESEQTTIFDTGTPGGEE